jgi:hypothetical protein
MYCTLPGIEKAQIQPQEFAGIPGQLRFDIEHRPGDQFKPGMIQVLRLAQKNARDNVEMLQTNKDDLELCILSGMQNSIVISKIFNDSTFV